MMWRPIVANGVVCTTDPGAAAHPANKKRRTVTQGGTVPNCLVAFSRAPANGVRPRAEKVRRL